MDYTKLIKDAELAGLSEADITLDDIGEFETTGTVARFGWKIWSHDLANEATQDGWESTKKMACVAEVAPGDQWFPATLTALEGLDKLYTQAGVTYYGHL